MVYVVGDGSRKPFLKRFCIQVAIRAEKELDPLGAVESVYGGNGGAGGAECVHVVVLKSRAWDGTRRDGVRQSTAVQLHCKCVVVR